MSFVRRAAFLLVAFCVFSIPHSASAALTLTSGNNATTTPNVATAITGFQIVGPSASTTPVKIHVTSGTVSVSSVAGVTMSGNNTATLNLSGTVANLNTALSSLTYSRSSTGSDTLEVALVNSDQIFFSDNGHVYQYVSSSLDWNAAFTAAQALTAYGVPGYLVTITSAAENNFVKARLSGDAWIGASDSGTEGTWKWVSGPEAGTTFWQGTSGGSTVGGNYASWASGEPNEYGSGEDCGEEYVASGSWNDLPCSGTSISGYVAEFGTPSELPTVVSKNVSIVTADVPAVTSLSPSTGSLTVNPNSNLVIGFSKSVSTSSGSILIKKTSDDSLVESIDVTGSRITGGGSSSITIDPTSVLPESTQLYVIVPSTAFKDASNNFFDGISSSSTWTFTTSDITSPVISNIASSTASTTATVTWTTDESASTRLWYSADTSYASSTVLADTSPRVTSHTASLSDLVACTLYNFKVVSSDASSNAATSTAATLLTSGCSGGVVPSSATSTTVTVSATATSTSIDSGRTLTVATPANFTATSSSVVIQIKGLASQSVLDSIGKPSGLSSAAGTVFNVTALINNTTELDSFDTPVTVSYAYTDSDVNGLDESTLKMYHYKNGVWEQLDNCSVNTGANTISCTAPHFSIFAIFGSAPASSSSATGSGGGALPWCSGPMAPGWNVSLPDGGCGATELSSTAVSIPQDTVTTCPAYTFSRTLRLGMKGEDVRALQRLMNCLGFTLAVNGPGSTGQETNVFASRTHTAVIKFQETYAAQILTPFAEAKGTGIFGTYSRKQAALVTQ